MLTSHRQVVSAACLLPDEPGWQNERFISAVEARAVQLYLMGAEAAGEQNL